MTKRSKRGDSPGTGSAQSKPKTAGKKSAPPSTARAAPSADKKTGEPPNAPNPAGAPAGGPAAAPAAGSPRPAHSRAPGQKEVIPFGWKVVGQSGGVALILFKSIERQDAEAHYERLAAEGYYQKLAIMENTAVVRQPKGAPKLVFTSAKSSVIKYKKKATAPKAKAAEPKTKVSAPKPKAPTRRAASPRTTTRAVAKSPKKKSATKKSTAKKSATKKAVAKAKARPKSAKKTPAKRR